MTILAPGAYDVEKVKLDFSPAYTMRPKTGKEKIPDVPAPNAYQPEKSLKAVKHNSPAYPFGIRPHIDPIDETPGKYFYFILFYAS